MNFKVFVDADRTLVPVNAGMFVWPDTLQSSVAAIFEEFKRRGLSAVEMQRKMLGLLNEISLRDVERVLPSSEVDDSFRRFRAFCRDKGIDVCIVSDGFNAPVQSILKRNGLTDIPVYASSCNILQDLSAERLYAIGDFPLTDAECSRCACCRRNVMLTRSGDDDVIVFVGSSAESACPVAYADVVFAREELQTLCQKENITYHHFTTFDDVVRRLGELLGRRRLYKRLKADHLRREVFLCE